ncbi:MAG: hypothetical protein HUU15_04715 [Candidatus Brocadiae bacterium]|nr:hypothetical protein [Candidatus Brocadiia bacterium]
MRLALSLPLACALLAGCAGFSEEEQRVIDASLSAPHAGDWARIPWEPDFETARQRALRENKPILAFLYVNQDGKKGSGEC